MGNSLHNKIYLGRHSLFRRIQAATLLGLAAGVGLAWMALRIWR